MYRPMHATESPSALGVEEYRALRATIRERGTVRVLVALITFVTWAALTLVAQAIQVVPVLALVPLIVLLAGFEILLAVHAGVERIGRYLQAYYEGDGAAPPRWEHLSVETPDSPNSRVGADAIFGWVFVAATTANLAGLGLLAASTPGPMIAPGVSLELAVFGLFHGLFVYRVFSARAAAARQRLADLEFFRRRR